jgi:hypothetical protein
MPPVISNDKASERGCEAMTFQSQDIEPSGTYSRPNPGTFARLIPAENTDRQPCNAKLRLRFARNRLFEASNNAYQIPVQLCAPTSTMTPSGRSLIFNKNPFWKEIS